MDMNNNDTTEFKKLFEKEEEEINNAIADIDELYKEVKDHYDVLKNNRSASGGRGLLSFIHQQTGNLVNLKNSKASLINNKILLKKYEYEIYLKEKKENNKENVNEELINQIMSRLEKNEDDEVYEDDTNFTDEDDILEKRLKKIRKDHGGVIDGLDSTDEDKDIKEEDGILGVYVKNKRWKFVGLNEYNKIIKGYPVPDKKGYHLKLHKDEDGTYTAEDQDGRLYPVIKK